MILQWTNEKISFTQTSISKIRLFEKSPQAPKWLCFSRSVIHATTPLQLLQERHAKYAILPFYHLENNYCMEQPHENILLIGRYQSERSLGPYHTNQRLSSWVNGVSQTNNECGQVYYSTHLPLPLPSPFCLTPSLFAVFFALAPSLQCFSNPRWRLINTQWNIQRSQNSGENTFQGGH